MIDVLNDRTLRQDVLDQGFVKLVDIMPRLSFSGTVDTAIVQAARVSLGQGETTTERDIELIRYLMRHKHTSPFEMVELKWHMRLPIFVARQIIRHRTANVNEISGRYSILPTDFYTPNKERIGKKGKLNKQGTDKPLNSIDASSWLDTLEKNYRSSKETYDNANDLNVANELARINLPVSTYTEWYWKIDLHNLFHFLRLRMDSHAQYEVQVYAKAMFEILNPIAPIACQAFEDYILSSRTFSRQEWTLIQRNLTELSSFKDIDIIIPNKSEQTDFLNKLR